MPEAITVTLTSCGRPDLLVRTLDSFLAYNTSPIERFIITEDTGEKLGIEENYPFIEWVYNKERFGLMGSVQKLHSMVKTPWIFHMEDDWEFYREGFIEKSLMVLQSHPRILQVWLRELDDTNGHPTDKEIFRVCTTAYKLMQKNFEECWSGYSLNPGLRRTKDVVDYKKIIGDAPTNGEHLIAQHYGEKGFRAAIFLKGYCKHIGWDRTVEEKH